MKSEIFTRRTRIEAPAAEVFAWHALPGALEKLTPAWERVRVVQSAAGIRDGAVVVLEIPAWPFHFRWTSVHQDYREGRSFTDVQTSGPFAYWKHVHSCEPVSEDACVLQDRIEYRLPLGIVGRLVAGWWVRRKLERLFAYRHAVTARDIAARRLTGARNE